MICNKDENPVDSAKRLVQLVIESIDNSNEAESLALVNSRAALDFQLRLALLELDLGKDQTLPQNDQQLSGYALSLRRVLVDFFGTDIDSHLKTGSRHQGLQAALAHNSHDEAKSHKPFSTGLPETPQALAKLEKQLLGLRKPNSSRPAGSHHRATIREDPDVNKVDESESENERHNASTSETSLLRNGRATNCSVDHKVPATVECQDTINKKNYATTFMSQADTFYKERIRPLEAKAIKVAVLDTGVDEEEIHFEAVRGNDGTSIRATKSFVEGSPHDTHDTDGHGTKVAALVVSMAPHVDLYIAKVSKTKSTLEKGQYVKAINWAIEHKVHIINISAKIKTKGDAIDNAIIKAEAQGIIILAAASNGGGNFPRAYPSNMDRVLAIHATDGNGNPCGFNPSPLKYDPNFSTLGEYIPSPLEAGGCLEAGTSFSSPIAAGMAANIITLAEACLDDRTLRCRASRKEGMWLIFKHASELRNGYRYLCPGNLATDSTDRDREWFKQALTRGR